MMLKEKKNNLPQNLQYYVLFAIFLGALFGYALRLPAFSFSYDLIIHILHLGGTIFLRLLKMVVIPLVVSSLFLGIANIGEAKDLKGIGIKAIFYFVFSSLFAILTGMVMVNAIKPGIGTSLPLNFDTKISVQSVSLWDQLAKIIPTNPIEALATYDMLGIILFTLIFAVFAIRVGGKDKDRLTHFMQSVYKVMFAMVESIILLAPFGVFCLIAKLIAETGFLVFFPLSWYLLTVFLALATHFFVILPLFITFLGGKHPYRYMQAMSPALVTAFSTASSAATLPVTYECSTLRGKVSEKIASIILPIGATVNMDGTALYEGVSVLFIAQVLGIELGLAQQFVILITALLVSIGAAGIPHSGLVMMVIILEAVGLPMEATALVWGVDRVIDMARTATNIWSDSCGALIVDANS